MNDALHGLKAWRGPGKRDRDRWVARVIESWVVNLRRCLACRIEEHFQCLRRGDHAGDDRLMLAAIHLTPIIDLADVKPVLEMGERSHAESDAALLLAIPAAIDLGPDVPPVELGEQSAHGAKLQIEAEDGADRLCLF